MRIKDVPFSPAYLVFHDAYDRGAMEIWPTPGIVTAKAIAKQKQLRLENSGNDECGHWKAYEKLPRVRVYRYNPKEATLDK